MNQVSVRRNSFAGLEQNYIANDYFGTVYIADTATTNYIAPQGRCPPAQFDCAVLAAQVRDNIYNRNDDNDYANANRFGNIAIAKHRKNDKYHRHY
jgi:hypothetical protein